MSYQRISPQIFAKGKALLTTPRMLPRTLPWRSIVVVVVASLVVVSAGALISRWFVQYYSEWRWVWMWGHPLSMLALIGGLIFALVLRNFRERRLLMLQRLAAIREMNHEIRNALELIQLSAYSTHHQQAIATISRAVDRIQWTLREMVSPRTGAEERASGRDDDTVG